MPNPWKLAQFASMWVCLGCITLAGMAAAQTRGIPADAIACDFEAWVVDAEGKVNIRAAPSPKAAVLGTLPAASKHLQSPDEGARVKVIAGKGDFFMIETVDLGDIESANPERKLGRVYRGRGWVHGSRLTFSIQRADGLRSAAASKAPITMPIRGLEPDGSGEPDAYVARVHACRGGKIEATLRTLEDKPLGRGWLITEGENGNPAPVQICANQLTTCS